MRRHSTPFRAALLGALVAAPVAAQAPTLAAGVARPIERVALTVAHSLPIDLAAAATQIVVADTAIADVVVLSSRSLLLTGKRAGETDVLLAGTELPRRHLRVHVAAAQERRQIVLSVKFAEVRRERLFEFGLLARSRNAVGDGTVTTGTGALADPPTSPDPLTATGRFLNAIGTWRGGDLQAFLSAEEHRGNARSLAEPTLLAGNRDTATFLAGGEIPIPIAQPQAGGPPLVVVQFRPFGIRLRFIGEVLGDSLVKLHVEPEVSTLDYANALLLSGFRIPALRTRRLETTVDVRPGESLVLSGLFNEEREQVRDGIPGLSQLPVIGALFSSTRWQKRESELLVVVTPELIDPEAPRPRDLMPPTGPARTKLPATEALPGTPGGPN